VFSQDQSRRVLEAARAFGLLPRLHADELAPSGGAELAVEVGAASADHLATPSAEGIAAMGAAADTDEPVVATLLPVTTWFLMKDHHAPARAFIDAGVPVAIGTDFNPGTSPTPNLALAMSFACINLRMTPDEVLAAVTINAARALALEDEVGSIEPGKTADLVIWRVPTSARIPYHPGADLVRTVIKRGRVVLDRP
jgi:imidazolonepropionase